MEIRQIGSYRVLEYIGSGGFGSVFKAEDTTSPGRFVAIKELHRKHTRNPAIKQRFFQEAVAMARLDHPNLPRLFTFGEDNGSYYLVMEMLSGHLLTDELHEGGPLEPRRATAITAQVLEAVSYAHRNGIIHRDLKPDNIMILDDDAGLRVKVLDFGIARMVGGENLTMTGEGFGTPMYMSPERISGASAVDHRTDIYSIGIILYEMLTGKAPFHSTSTDPAVYWTEMRRLHETEPLPGLSTLGLPAELEAVVERAAAKRAEDRYATADEMLAALRELNDEEISAAARPRAASLALMTQPAGAEVFVDNLPRGASDAERGRLVIDDLPAGLHNVRVTKAGYNDYRIDVLLEAGCQTDLQVALPARATRAMPALDATSASAGETHAAGDEEATALLTVEDLPAGSTIYIGADPITQADEDGRATLRLKPGAHELQVEAPDGARARRTVNISESDIGARQALTVPLARGEATTAPVTWFPPARHLFVKVAAVILLLALVAAGLVLIRDRKSARSDEAAITEVQVVEETAAGDQQPEAPAAEGNKLSEEAARLREEAARLEEQAARLEAESAKSAPDPAKIALLKKQIEELQKALARKEKPGVTVAVAPTPPPARTPPATASSQMDEPEEKAAEKSGKACLTVRLMDEDEKPASGLTIMMVEEVSAVSGASPGVFNGTTDKQGRWNQCGLTPGHRMRLVIFAPGRKLVATRKVVVGPGRTEIVLKTSELDGFTPRQFGLRPSSRPK